MRQWCPPFPFPFLMSLLVCVSYLALIAVSPQRNCLDAAITVCPIPPCQKITFPSSGFSFLFWGGGGDNLFSMTKERWCAYSYRSSSLLPAIYWIFRSRDEKKWGNSGCWHLFERFASTTTSPQLTRVACSRYQMTDSICGWRCRNVCNHNALFVFFV